MIGGDDGFQCLVKRGKGQEDMDKNQRSNDTTNSHYLESPTSIYNFKKEKKKLYNKHPALHVELSMNRVAIRF